MNTYKAQAVVEVTLDAGSRDEAKNLVSRTLSGLDLLTGGRVRTFDYSGDSAVRRDDRKLRNDYRRVDEIADEALDTSSLAGGFDYLFAMIDVNAANKARARRELTKIRKALLS